MTNKEWLETLTPDEWWEVTEWLFHDYGRGFTDTRLAIIEWLYKHHDEQQNSNTQTACESCKHFTEDQSEYHWCHMCEMEHSCYEEKISNNNN